MTTAECAPSLCADEVERVLRWRLGQLIRSGYEAVQAMMLASQSDVDLHVACGLLRRGCPPTTAMRILL